MNLYGQDMDEDTDPLAAGLGWTVAWQPAERNFIGRRALEARREAPDAPRFVGLLLEGRGVLRAHQAVLVDGEPAGEITSGGFSPTLERSIALARVSPAAAEAQALAVDIRGKAVPARVVKPPFVRNGQPKITL
jgi:aminomethyltransferase